MSQSQRHKLRQIKDLTQAEFEAARAALQQACRVTSAIRADIAALDEDRRQAASVQGENLVSTSRAYVQWARWADLRRAQLNAALARALADENTKKAKAARAFGRDSAAGKVIEKQELR